MSSYSEDVLWIHRGKVCIIDGGSGLFVMRYEIYVKNIVEIKLALNLITISNDVGNYFPKPHFVLGSCIGGREGSRSLVLSSDDGLWII